MSVPDDKHPADAISACEWVFGHRPLDQITELLATAGYGGMELAGEPQRADREELPALLDRVGLRASGITPTCRWPTDDRDLTHAERGARRRAIAYYQACADLAAEVGATSIGVIPTSVGRFEPMTSVAQEWELAAEGVDEIAYYAGERGVTVAIEPVNRYETFLVNTAAEASELAGRCRCENVAIVLDTYHMNIEEEASVEAVASAKRPLAAVHLADSNRRGLGHGQADWRSSVYAALRRGFRGPFVLECTAPGANPFEAQKDPEAMALLDDYVRESATVVGAALEREGSTTG